MVSAIEFLGKVVDAIYPDRTEIQSLLSDTFFRVTCRLEWPLYRIGKKKIYIG